MVVLLRVCEIKETGTSDSNTMKKRRSSRKVTGQLAEWSYEVITDSSDCEKIIAGIERNNKFKALKEAGFCFSPPNGRSAKGTPCQCVHACHPKV